LKQLLLRLNMLALMLFIQGMDFYRNSRASLWQWKLQALFLLAQEQRPWND
jgi:hypothetical protein